MAKETAAAKKKREAAEAAAKANTAAPRNLLAEAINATNTGAPLMATEAEMDGLLKDPRGPLVEFNANMRQGDKIAFRATALGVSVGSAPAAPAAGGWGAPQGGPAPQPQAPANPAPAASQAAPSAPSGTPKFAHAVGVPLPSPRRGGRGSTVYGFESMAVGASFFIPADGDNPNPAKRVASTVSSASDRLTPKKFIVRSVVTDEAMARAWNVAVGVKGAGVWRTE